MGIGTKLTKLMKEQNTNANELSSKANVPAQTIYSLIRRDASKVDIDSLLKIARALGVSVDYFGSDDIGKYETAGTSTIAAHFDGSEYTEEELNKIREFAAFVKSSRK